MTRIIRGRARDNCDTPTGLLRVHRGRAKRPSTAKFPAAVSERGVSDRALDGAPPQVDPSYGLGMVSLAIVAPLGLSLFLIAGFAAALSLNNSMTLVGPSAVRTCEGLFFWLFILFSCVTSRRRETLNP
jgi:hypothetical protein